MVDGEEHAASYQIRGHQAFPQLIRGARLSLTGFGVVGLAIVAAQANAMLTGGNWSLLVLATLVPGWILVLVGSKMERSAIRSFRVDIPDTAMRIIIRMALRDSVRRTAPTSQRRT